MKIPSDQPIPHPPPSNSDFDFDLDSDIEDISTKSGTASTTSVKDSTSTPTSYELVDVIYTREEGIHTPSETDSSISDQDQYQDHNNKSEPPPLPLIDADVFDADYLTEQSRQADWKQNPHANPYSAPPPTYQDQSRGENDGENCEIFRNLPAVWTIQTHKFIMMGNEREIVGRGREIRLSARAAAVLIAGGRVRGEELVLYKTKEERRLSEGPSDPISGVLVAAHNVVGGVLHGVADYPIQLVQANSVSSFANAFSPTSPDGPKGVSRIVGTALQAPMHVTMNVSQGFGNLPSLWGDAGREKAEVKGIGSGLAAAGKGFGLGLYDGITGLVTQPYIGVVEGSKAAGSAWGGVLGGLKGFGKGIGGAVCKPAAGAVGLPAYAFKGIYEEVKGQHARYNLIAEGEKEWKNMSSEVRDFGLMKWDILVNEEGSKRFRDEKYS